MPDWRLGIVKSSRAVVGYGIIRGMEKCFNIAGSCIPVLERLPEVGTARGETIGRIGWIDALKAILIVLVVAGHVFGMASHYVPASATSYYEFIFKVIYAFHMPAFFMLAGLMTSEASQSISIVLRFGKLFKRLLVPYFFFGLVGAIVYMVVMPCFGKVSAGATGYYDQFGSGEWWHPWASLLYGAAFPGTDGFRCNSVLWFLPCMFSVKLLGGLLLRIVGIASYAVRIIILMIIPIVFLGWASQYCHIPSLPYGLSYVLWYFPFFLVGYCLRPILIECVAKGASTVGSARFLAWAVMLGVFVVLVWYLPNNTIYFRSHLCWYLVETVLGCLGAFLSIGVAMVMPKMLSGMCFQLSATSIGIMFLHKYIVLAVTVVPGVKGLWASSLPGGFLISLFTIIVSTVTAWAISACIKRFAPWIIGMT